MKLRTKGKNLVFVEATIVLPEWGSSHDLDM